MAVTPGEVNISREQVYAWIEAYNSNPVGTLEDYIRARVGEVNLPDEMVNTTGSEHLGDETPIVDMILSDLDSYPNAPGYATGS